MCHHAAARLLWVLAHCCVKIPSLTPLQREVQLPCRQDEPRKCNTPLESASVPFQRETETAAAVVWFECGQGIRSICRSSLLWSTIAPEKCIKRLVFFPIHSVGFSIVALILCLLFYYLLFHCGSFSGCQSRWPIRNLSQAFLSVIAIASLVAVKKPRLEMMHSMTAGEASLDNAGSNHATRIEMVGEDAKSEAVISEDIDRFLPMEVSSAESEDGENDEDSELLDDIVDEEQTATETANNNSDDNADKGAARVDDLNKNFRGRPSSCVFVASLAASLSDDELYLSVTSSFKQYGELARVKVLRDHANRPYAFVQYKNDQDAKRALKMAQGSMLNGRTLRCESARVNRTLFISHNDPLQFNKIVELCEKFGELEQLVPNKEQTHRRYDGPVSNGSSWFVQFAYRDDAIRAFANLRSEPDWDVEWVQNIEVPKHFNLLNVQNIKNDRTDDTYRNGQTNENDTDEPIDGDDVDVDDRRSDSEIDSNNFETIDRKSIFIGQLDPSVTKEKLNDRFSNHGEIVDINLINKSTNIFAFIQFETEEAAAAALERENHAIFLSKTMHVQYKIIGGHHGKRNRGRNNVTNWNHDRNGINFNGPQINLAPPPINMYRRRSYEPEPMLPYIAPAMPSHSDFEINPFNPYMRNALRRTSLPNGFSSSRSYSLKSESENTICGDGATDATSDISASAGKTNSTTTNNNSSAGSIGQNNSNENKNHLNRNGKKKLMKRGNYNEPPKPYYFQPYYYHPMHYPIGPMGPSHPSPGPGGNQPYMMVYPIPPPPATGVDGSMMAPAMPLCQPDPRIHGSPSVSQAHFGQMDSNDFTAAKPYNLDY